MMKCALRTKEDGAFKVAPRLSASRAQVEMRGVTAGARRAARVAGVRGVQRWCMREMRCYKNQNVAI